nr:hypothetical protein [uncultured Roseateles sp.]
MSDSDKQKSGFFDAIREGYKEQDDKLATDQRTTQQKILEGAAVGATESLFHPFRWLRSLLK